MRRIKVSWEARCTKTKRNEVSCRACAASFPRRSRFFSLLYSCIHIRFDTEAVYSPALQQRKATAMDEPPTPPTIAAWRS